VKPSLSKEEKRKEKIGEKERKGKKERGKERSIRLKQGQCRVSFFYGWMNI